MQALRSNEPSIREQLKTARNRLLKEFQGNPSKFELAIEIKRIDDMIAELTRAFSRQRRTEARDSRFHTS